MKRRTSLRSLRGAKDTAGVSADFDQVVELKSENGRAYANRGVIVLMQDREAAAQDDFDRAFKQDSNLRAMIQKADRRDLKSCEKQT